MRCFSMRTKQQSWRRPTSAGSLNVWQIRPGIIYRQRRMFMSFISAPYIRTSRAFDTLISVCYISFSFFPSVLSQPDYKSILFPSFMPRFYDTFSSFPNLSDFIFNCFFFSLTPVLSITQSIIKQKQPNSSTVWARTLRSAGWAKVWMFQAQTEVIVRLVVSVKHQELSGRKSCWWWTMILSFFTVLPVAMWSDTSSRSGTASICDTRLFHTHRFVSVSPAWLSRRLVSKFYLIVLYFFSYLLLIFFFFFNVM